MKLFLMNALPYISIFSLTALIFVGLPLELAKHYTIFETGLTLASFYFGTIITPFLFYKLTISSITTRITLIVNITAVSAMFISLNIIDGVYLTMLSLFLLGVGKNIVLTFYDSDLITKNYKLYRGIGSIAFVATTLSIGLGYISLGIIGILLSTIFLMNYFALFYMRKEDTIILSRNVFSIKNMLEYKIFWLSILSHRIGMGVFLSFAGIFVVHKLGYSELEFSYMWILAASLEAIVLLFYIKVLSIKSFIYFSLFATFIRFQLIFLFPEYYGVLLLSQALHMFSYATYHLNILKTINLTFKERTPINIKIYNAISEGMALIFGSVIGIYLNNSSYFFLVLSIFTVISLILLNIAFKKETINTVE